MNELNIYNIYNYRKLKKISNIYCDGGYKWYNAKTVFSPLQLNCTISINKNKIRICYWDEYSEKGKQTIIYIKNYILQISKESNDMLYYTGQGNEFKNCGNLERLHIG